MKLDKWDVISAVAGAVILLACLVAIMLGLAGCEFDSEEVANVTNIDNKDGTLTVIIGSNVLDESSINQ